MNKQEISFRIDLGDRQMVETGCWNQFDAVVTLDGVEYEGAVIAQGDPRGTADFPGLPEDVMEKMSWVPYWVSERLYEYEDEEGFYDSENLLVDRETLRYEFEEEFYSQFGGGEEFEVTGLTYV